MKSSGETDEITDNQVSGLSKEEDRRVSGANQVQLVKNPPAMQETMDQYLGREDAGEGMFYPLQCSWTSLVAQLVKNLPAMWETWVQSLDWEDSLEECMTSQSSILAWRNPMHREAW